ncbi:MAG TPA: ATP-binding protein [Devosiaceae bacterium]|nr:ATP-binding protein [Devosiaceae bacterium]
MSVSYGENFNLLDRKPFSSTVRLVDGPLGLTWQHSSITAEYFGEFYGLHAAAGGFQYNLVRHSVVYLVNELLENALKFRAPGDIEIRTAFADGSFEIVVSNLISGATAERFRKLLAEIVARDPGELLIERIEANAADENSSGSGLGLLTLMNDYEARLGWRFDQAGTSQITQLRSYAALEVR